MSKVCEICSKSVLYGQNIKHKHAGKWALRAPKTKKFWEPNVRKVNMTVDGETQKVTVCMKCYKKIRKIGE